VEFTSWYYDTTVHLIDKIYITVIDDDNNLDVSYAKKQLIFTPVTRISTR